MAITPFQYYTDTDTTRQDLTDLVTNISPEDTPYVSMAPRGPRPQSRVHTFPTDSLGARSAGTPQIEGFAITSGALTGRTILTNWVEILAEKYTVGHSVRWMNQVGTKDELAYQRTKAAKNLAIRMEYRHWNATGASGASGTAPEEKGILAWITSETSTASANRSITETIMNSVLDGIYDNGGNPKHIFCTPARGVNLKNLISSTWGTRNVPGEDGKLQNYVRVYESIYGTFEVIPSRDVPGDAYAILELDKWPLCYAVPPKIMRMGLDGYRDSEMIVAEYSIEARAEGSSGKIEDIDS